MRRSRSSSPRRRSTSACTTRRSPARERCCTPTCASCSGSSRAEASCGSSHPTRPAHPARGRRAARSCSSRDLWPDLEGAALLTTPLMASDEQLGLLCVLRPRRFGAGDEELLRALADQTAMGLERAELITRLTARDRVKDMFDALAASSADSAVLAAAPSGCDLARPHVLLHGEVAAGSNGAGADWEAVSTRLGARLRGRDQVGFFDAGPAGLRAVVLMPSAAAAERVVLGVSAPGRGIAESRQALREAARAAHIARTLKPAGGALGYEQLGAYKYLVDLRLEESPRDRHWTAVEALLEHDRQRRTALLDTLEEYLARRRSVADTARTLYIHPNTLRQRLARIERVTELTLDAEDLLALELAVKLVRLDDARRRAGA